MANSAHARTDREIARVQRHLAGIYADAKKDVTGALKPWAASIEKRAAALLVAVNDAEDEAAKRTAKAAYISFYAQAVKSKQFRAASATAQARLYFANVQAAQYINSKTAKVYADNYNTTGASLGRSLDGYGFKPVSVADAERYGDITRQTVDRGKDTAWNARNITTAVMAGAALLLTANALTKHAAGSVAERNRAGSRRQASDMLTDAESKGTLDSLWRAADEGFDEIQKEWTCTFDNRTRDTHIEYNDLGPVPLDYEYTDGLQRPRDPNCGDPAEVCNCRCALTYKTVLQKPGTRSAREGTVTGSYKRARSFRDTETVYVQDMTFKEWMEWRSK